MTTRNKKNAKTKTPGKCWKDWIKDIQRLMIKDLGCRLKRDLKKDKNGNSVGFENSRLVMTAQLVECDYILTVDVEPENGSFAGLSISRFTGLSIDTDDEVYAHFQNGRVLRWIRIDTPDITDPQECTSRELKWQRLHDPRTKSAAKAHVALDLRQEFAALAEGLKKSAIINTPPDQRTCADNLKIAFDRETQCVNKIDKWTAVAHEVVDAAIKQSKISQRGCQSLVLTSAQLNNLIKKLQSSGYPKEIIIRDLAANFDRSMRRRKQASKNKKQKR